MRATVVQRLICGLLDNKRDIIDIQSVGYQVPGTHALPAVVYWSSSGETKRTTIAEINHNIMHVQQENADTKVSVLSHRMKRLNLSPKRLFNV